ncbi:hypothetical protein GALL_455080 [mine drainage metagenome]|uniref:Uncharacterized protein n=1 Tax=mine drainage metagenome TaxID=410659 RepID=A0A1J5PPX8_9ZZZZ
MARTAAGSLTPWTRTLVRRRSISSADGPAPTSASSRVSSSSSQSSSARWSRESTARSRAPSGDPERASRPRSRESRPDVGAGTSSSGAISAGTVTAPAGLVAPAVGVGASVASRRTSTGAIGRSDVLGRGEGGCCRPGRRRRARTPIVAPTTARVGSPISRMVVSVSFTTPVCQDLAVRSPARRPRGPQSRCVAGPVRAGPRCRVSAVRDRADP